MPARDYLEPDSGNPADLLVAGAMAAMFFTPLGGKVIGGAMRGAMRGAKFAGKAGMAAVTKAGKAATSAAAGIDKKATIMGAKNIGLKAWTGAKAFGRGGSRAADYIMQHRKAIAPIAIGGAVVGGTIVGTAGRRDSGPERYTRFENGMPADNLGATGDLTLALHKRR